MAATSMTVRDAGGNLRDIAQEEAGGVRTPRYVPEVGGAAVSPSNPLPVQGPVTDAQMRAAALPTADAGLGTDGATPPSIIGTGVRGWLRAIYERLLATLSVSDAEARAVQGAVALTVGGSLVTAGRGLYVLATADGQATLTLADGSVVTVEIITGGQMLPFAVRGVAAGAAAGTYSKLI